MPAQIGHAVLVAMALSGASVLIVGCYQFLLATIHGLRHPYRETAEYYPRVAVIIPAWNEAQVLERTIDRMMALSYPEAALRVYVVDDASTDETPALLARKASEYGDRVVHLRRERGGEGKSHTINHGLRKIRSEGWFEAILVIDADVIFTPTALRRMARHLADEKVGAVTAYIKEGSSPANYINRFVGFEYVTAQAAARRAQNVLGAQACLAGGAQLIRRDALEAAGGEIDTSSLAEDTFTTFNVQLAGYRVKFEGNAIVWAEEPNTVVALWKQRERWSRGNAQVTLRFRKVWLRPWKSGRLGGLSFAAIWFSVVFMPLFMISASIGLVTLFFVDRELSVQAFTSLWALTGFTYLFITFSSLALDRPAARKSWFQGLMFPGLINLTLIVFGLWGEPLTAHFSTQLSDVGLGGGDPLSYALLLAADVWLSASMLAAYLLKRLEGSGRVPWLVRPLVYLVGYGALLCAITFSAYIKEMRGAELRWEKTEKTGQVGEFA
jgi:cellulose synthase/poly-beta-1,6-N-acetylglucosamine synthase-like glycosyltransferase